MYCIYTGSTVHACIQYMYIHVHGVLQLLNSLLQASSPHQQTLLVRMLTATLGVMTRQVHVYSQIFLTAHFESLSSSVTHLLCVCVVCMCVCVCVCAEQVVCRQAPEYLPRLLGQATHCPHTPSSTHSAMCYASIVNKTRGEIMIFTFSPHLLYMYQTISYTVYNYCYSYAGEDLGQFLDSDMASLWQRITDSAASDDKTRTRSLTTWLWVYSVLLSIAVFS